MPRIPLMRRMFPVVVARRKRPLFSVAAALWRPADQLHSRVMLDLTGGRAHAYAGSTKCAFIGGRSGPGVSLQLPGTTTNHASTPDHASLDITGDIDLRAKIDPDSWTAAAPQTIISKGSGSTASYRFRLTASGGLGLLWSPDGAAFPTADSTVAVGGTPGVPLWVRGTLDVDNGAGGRTATFYTSPDGVTWTQLGAPVTQAGVTSFQSSTGVLEVGTRSGGTGDFFTGRIYAAQVLSGIGGSVAFSADFSAQAEGTLSFVEATGKTVTVNQAGIDPGTAPKYLLYSGTKSWYASGGAASKASTPDSAAVSVTGDIDLRVKVALDDWTPSNTATLMAKTAAGVGNAGWKLYITSAGNVAYRWSVDGTSTSSATSTATTGLADGAVKWIRVTHDLDNGAIAGTVTFYTSDNGSSWTQLGSAVTVTVVATNTFDNGQPVTFAQTADDADRAVGRFFEAEIYGSLNGTNKVFDVDFTNMTAPFKTVTETANSATVTINYPLSARPGAYIDRTMWTLGGSDYFEVVDLPQLDFAAADDFSVIAALCHPNQSATTTQTIMAKKADNAAGVGWGLFKSATANELAVQIADGTNTVTARSVVAGQDGQYLTSALVRKVNLDQVEAYQDRSLGTPASDTTTATLTNALPLRIGALSDGGTTGAFQFLGGGVWREAVGLPDLDEADREFGTDK